MTTQMILCLAVLIFMMVGYVVGSKFKISNGAVAMMSIVLICLLTVAISCAMELM